MADVTISVPEDVARAMVRTTYAPTGPAGRVSDLLSEALPKPEPTLPVEFNQYQFLTVTSALRNVIRHVAERPRDFAAGYYDRLVLELARIEDHARKLRLNQE
jgi:hypothetical protein